MGNAILHAFNWSFKEIEHNLDNIRNAGYSAILTSPVTYSSGDEWFKRYQPLDLRIVRSPLGNKQDLIDLLASAKEAGKKEIDIHIDIVINHMAHRDIVNGYEDLNFPGFNEVAKYQSNLSFEQDKLYGDLRYNQFSEADFNPNQKIPQDAYDNPQKIDEVRQKRLSDKRAVNGLPDFEINDWVISQQKQLLIELHHLGVKGFRIDAVKHVPVQHITALMNDPILRNKYYFAEVIPAGHGQFIQDVKRSTTMSMYDFPLFYQIRYSFGYKDDNNQFYFGNSFHHLVSYENNPTINKFRSVTFVNTHDIPNNDEMHKQTFLNIDDELLAYTYILGRNGGRPLIFTDKGNNQHQTKSFNNRWKDFYAHNDLQKMLTFHNTAHGKDMTIIKVTDGIIVGERHYTGFFVINKTSDQTTLNLDFTTLDGDYKNVFDGSQVTISNKNCTLTIPAGSKMMFLHK